MAVSRNRSPPLPAASPPAGRGERGNGDYAQVSERGEKGVGTAAFDAVVGLVGVLLVSGRFAYGYLVAHQASGGWARWGAAIDAFVTVNGAGNHKEPVSVAG